MNQFQKQSLYVSNIKPEEILKIIIAQSTQNISAGLIEKNQQKQKNLCLQEYYPPCKKTGIGYVGWSEQQSTNQKKSENLGETNYTKQIGNEKLTDYQICINSNTMNWLKKDFIKQYEEQINKKSQPQQSKLDLSTYLNIESMHKLIFANCIAPPKFPSPIIKYKIIPYLAERKVLESTSTNDFINGLKKNNMVVNNYHGGPNQLFYIKEAGPSTYYLVNVAKGFVVRLPNHSSKSDAPVYADVRTQNKVQNTQLWKLVPCKNAYLIESVGKPGYVLEIFGLKVTKGAHVILGKKLQKNNQKWGIYPC